MGATDPAAWSEFALALVGATAALAGLIFVAISINLREILSGPGLTGRAGEAVLTLMLVLIACALLLVPEQGTRALGIEWIALAILCFAILTRSHVRAIRAIPEVERVIVYGRIFTHDLMLLLFVVAGIATATDAIGGLYWIAPAALWGVVVGVSDAWVLMIEILR